VLCVSHAVSILSRDKIFLRLCQQISNALDASSSDFVDLSGY
jgi:hypothetical protein